MSHDLLGTINARDPQIEVIYGRVSKSRSMSRNDAKSSNAREKNANFTPMGFNRLER
jgi:hypothetical protein